MSRLLRVGLAGTAAVVLASCAPALPPGYHVDATGERTANSEDQVMDGIKELADKTPSAAVLQTKLPTELTAVPVPGNAIARRYERKQRKADICTAWALTNVSVTPSLTRLKDLRGDASLIYTQVHGIDTSKRYVDASITVKRGETRKRRVPVEVKAALAEVEKAAHAYFAQLYFAEQLEKRGKLDAEKKHALVQQALDTIAGPEASQAFTVVNTFAIVHCLGGPA